MVTDYVPVGDYVLLEKIEKPKSAIIMVAPDVRTNYTLAKVLAVGPLVPANFGIKAGDTVWVRSTTGEQYEDGSDKYWWISVARNDLLGVRK